MSISPLLGQLIRKRVLVSMTSSVTVLRGDLGGFDPLTGIVGGLTNTVTVYAGPAHIRTVSAGVDLSVGDVEIGRRQTVISIPLDSPMPHEDDVVIVSTDDSSDPDLDQRTFRVTSVEGGSLFGDARRMYCSGFLQSRQWSG